MDELNLASVIVSKRREKGITQEHLAEYIGVTKASVSKWENGLSYPDIVLLPRLASYFDLTIDALLGFTAQLDERQIQAVYQELALDFFEKDFEEVINKSQTFVKKYYSCYPLLLKMVLLYINHVSLARDEQQMNALMTEALALCTRIRENSKNIEQLKEATSYQAMCYLILKKGEAVLTLIGETVSDENADGLLIAQAFQLLGNVEKAQETLQIEAYQKLTAFYNCLLHLIQSNLGNFAEAETAYLRAEALSRLFNMRTLSPNSAAGLYALGAQMYQLADLSEKALELLEKYVDVCVDGFFPIDFHGDAFFDKVEDWLEHKKFVPRNEKVVKESMIRDVLQNPIFEPLRQRTEFIKMNEKITNYLGGN
ncbi:helix-turn-helix domain-containing protein [Enterococcus wangshanyuanii]|uniref:Transcriptional regulator n=1 Tax=Enterococcus wangshanyuanii TaxID=2005703 RepID=A0ABQ1NLT4_9ENTE|nr:helix-turn-helix transcriptional regulator [Enterococcus wangshanyuanii]GGC80292.1 transcriptional regulator [Enterococcus wangshanyuanii]